MGAIKKPIADMVEVEMEGRGFEKKPETILSSSSVDSLTDRSLTIRISSADHVALKAMFARQGLSISAGIRLVMRTFIMRGGKL